MHKDELELLLEKARNLDEDALAALFEAYYSKVLKFMHYRVGAGEAEDLAGEVFARVVGSMRRQKGSFEPWLYRIARNIAIDRIRRKYAKPETEWDEHMTAEVTNGNDVREDAARHLDLQHALGKLTDDQREVLSLKFMQGLTTAEVCTVTDRKPEAIRALQFRALASLREIFKREDSSHASHA